MLVAESLRSVTVCVPIGPEPEREQRLLARHLKQPPIVPSGQRAVSGMARPNNGFYFFLVRVAPPRPRSWTPDSLRTRWMNPYERPVDSASARMLAPRSYFFFKSAASLSRVEAVIRAPSRRPTAVGLMSACGSSEPRASGAGLGRPGAELVTFVAPKPRSAPGSTAGVLRSPDSLIRVCMSARPAETSKSGIDASAYDRRIGSSARAFGSVIGTRLLRCSPQLA